MKCITSTLLGCQEQQCKHTGTVCSLAARLMVSSRQDSWRSSKAFPSLAFSPQLPAVTMGGVLSTVFFFISLFFSSHKKNAKSINMQERLYVRPRFSFSDVSGTARESSQVLEISQMAGSVWRVIWPGMASSGGTAETNLYKVFQCVQ